jgi:hypothetical protein
LKNIDVKAISDEIFEKHSKLMHENLERTMQKLESQREQLGESRFLQAVIRVNNEVNFHNTKNYMEELIQNIVDEIQTP